MLFQKFQQFMYGRYGGDKFSLFLLVIALVLSLFGALFWPIALVVLANVVYNISTKSTPAGANAFLSLAVIYLIAGICAILLYLLQGGHQKFTAELSKLNWTSIALGISVVALEFGYIYVYRAGWTVNTASLVANIALACVLVFVGFFLYKESLSFRQLIGIGVCVFGLFLIK